MFSVKQIYFIVGIEIIMRLGNIISHGFEFMSRSHLYTRAWKWYILLRILSDVFLTLNSLVMALSAVKGRRKWFFSTVLLYATLRYLGIYFYMNYDKLSKEVKDHLPWSTLMDHFITKTVHAYIFMQLYTFVLHYVLEYCRTEEIHNYGRKDRFGRLKLTAVLRFCLVALVPNGFLTIWRTLKALHQQSAEDLNLFTFYVAEAVVWITLISSYIYDVAIGSKFKKVNQIRRCYYLFLFGVPLLSAITSNYVGSFKNILMPFTLHVTYTNLVTLNIALMHWVISYLKYHRVLRRVKVFSTKQVYANMNDEIGSGFFGSIFLGYISKSCKENIEVAVKLFRNDDAEGAINTKNELKGVMRLLPEENRHYNVINIHGLLMRDQADCFGRLGVVMEFCRNGSLDEFLQKMEIRNLNLFQIRGQFSSWALQIADGMAYLQNLKIVHGDLAARNVLLDDIYSCKITDFGMSKNLYEYHSFVSESGGVFPWRWMAPESLDSLTFSFKTDVWSYGILLWEIYSLGQLPYADTPWSSEFATDLMSGVRPLKPAYSTPDVYEVMMKCWSLEPKDRPSFENCVESCKIWQKGDQNV